MKLKIEFSTDNAAFSDDDLSAALEAGRILQELASKVSPDGSGIIRDHNGNAIGSWRWEA